MLISLALVPLSLFVLIRVLNFSNSIFALFLSLCISYIPTYFSTIHKKVGYVSHFMRNMKIWEGFCKYFDAKIVVEEPLCNEQQYIFCNFPHGAASINHFMTMTNGCGMFSNVYNGPRRDLVASVLFLIPGIREFVLSLGCVDASARTAHHNLKKGRSVLIFIGGEKEQLMTEVGKHKIFLKNRKGFRHWLQEKFQLGLPIMWGRYGTLIPHKVPIRLEIGKPIPVTRLPKEEITAEVIDNQHKIFIEAMIKLFDRTKKNYPGAENATLEIY